MKSHQEHNPVGTGTPQHVPSEPEDEDDVSSFSQEAEAEAEADFKGDSLQAAQDKIMSELTRLKDSE